MRKKQHPEEVIKHLMGLTDEKAAQFGGVMVEGGVVEGGAAVVVSQSNRTAFLSEHLSHLQ